MRLKLKMNRLFVNTTKNINPFDLMATVKIYSSLLLALLLLSCTPTDRLSDSDFEEKEEDIITQFFNNSEIFAQSITGFALYDPEAGIMLHSRDADRFFTPASNMKMFTLYSALKSLPDTLPSLYYTVQSDTLYFHGTGDPAFLNPNFEENNVYDFLKDREETLVYADYLYEDEHFGSGWAWDWYPAAYAPEKTPFPIYGNMMRLQTQQVALVMLNEDEPVKPAFFERYIKNQGWDGEQTELVKRDYQTNQIMYAPKSDTARQERNIPFKYEKEFFIEMLSDTLGREVVTTDKKNIEFTETLYSTPADTLYKRMMVVSDNFVAEQLMLMISWKEFGVMNTAKAIEFSVENYLEDLPTKPQWRDGSGLTRYNLITPKSTVYLLEKIMDELGEEKALSFFPVGGVSGTIRGYYHAPEGEPPFVYAKTGTLSNNTALSGYVYTNSGKRLNFSFINNNYVISNHAIRSEMGRLLSLIKENY